MTDAPEKNGACHSLLQKGMLLHESYRDRIYWHWDANLAHILYVAQFSLVWIPGAVPSLGLLLAKLQAHGSRKRQSRRTAQCCMPRQRSGIKKHF